ncbi:hypothetical protein EYF80_023654 [Liparis tanakae]|uniref:Uncharacterized protein n=1 Tax=Liparis tanakae TaxID=230148 RepID=A0A4Z2HK81_9TELE|nr:hypothetical protein EYF80_023654 [Liparis tanakae]
MESESRQKQAGEALKDWVTAGRWIGALLRGLSTSTDGITSSIRGNAEQRFDGERRDNEARNERRRKTTIKQQPAR